VWFVPRGAGGLARLASMRNGLLASILVGLTLSACGGGGDGDPDARPSGADAPASAVHQTTCTGSEQTIMTSGNSYSPDEVQIAPGQAVHFMLGSSHNVVSTTSGQAFSLPFGANACLTFDTAGTYTFRCQPHSFTGSVVVQ
jgi:plastocyanin